MEHISQLTVHDIDNILSKRTSTAESSARVLSDHDVALAFFAEEATGLLNISKDRAKARGSDSEALADELYDIEQMALYDHLVAVALSEGRDPPPLPPMRGRARRLRQQAMRLVASSQIRSIW